MPQYECPGCRKLKRRVEELEALVRELQERLNQNGSNSSRPPSKRASVALLTTMMRVPSRCYRRELGPAAAGLRTCSRTGLGSRGRKSKNSRDRLTSSQRRIRAAGRTHHLREKLLE